jgi:TetR/AcrR family transcriptional regulator
MGLRHPQSVGNAREGSSRSAILRAAERIFAGAGLAGARTDAIARAARVNKALLYYYFKSKDALYRAVLEEHLKEFNRLGLEVLSRRGPARSTVIEYVGMHFDFISARPFYPALVQRFMMAGERQFRQLSKYILPVGRELGRVIERGVRAGEFRPVDSRNAAISLVGLTAFYFVAAPAVRLVTRGNPYGKAQLDQRRKEVLDFVRYGLFREPEAR